MTETFRKAFEKASVELTEHEQDEFGEWLLEKLESDERRWDEAFSGKSSKLKNLVAQALEDIRKGRTEPLDLKKL